MEKNSHQIIIKMEVDNILAQMDNFDWNVEVILASSNPAQVLRPLVRLTIIHSSGDDNDNHQKILELSVEQFSEFRYKVAEALKIVNDVKSNKFI